MVFLNDLSEIVAVKMGINFGGGNGLMTQHFLYSPQIGSALNEVSSEGVPKGVRTHFFVQPCFIYQIFDVHKNHLPTEFFPPAV